MSPEAPWDFAEAQEVEMVKSFRTPGVLQPYVQCRSEGQQTYVRRQVRDVSDHDLHMQEHNSTPTGNSMEQCEFLDLVVC